MLALIFTFFVTLIIYFNEKLIKCEKEQREYENLLIQAGKNKLLEVHEATKHA